MQPTTTSVLLDRVAALERRLLSMERRLDNFSLHDRSTDEDIHMHNIYDGLMSSSSQHLMFNDEHSSSSFEAITGKHHHQQQSLLQQPFQHHLHSNPFAVDDPLTLFASAPLFQPLSPSLSLGEDHKIRVYDKEAIIAIGKSIEFMENVLPLFTNMKTVINVPAASPPVQTEKTKVNPKPTINNSSSNNSNNKNNKDVSQKMKSPSKASSKTTPPSSSSKSPSKNSNHKSPKGVSDNSPPQKQPSRSELRFGLLVEFPDSDD